MVLDQHIKSMTEFKQIIGRGTRINEDYGKTWFTIIDFKKATELFADEAFDGEPVPPDEGDGDEPENPDDSPDDTGGEGGGDGGTGDGGTEPPGPEGHREKYVMTGQQVPVKVAAERVQYYGADGKLITESLRDYTRGQVQREFSSLDAFLRRWSSAEQKKAVIEELTRQGVMWEPLAEEVNAKRGQALDPFDLICHVVFDRPPLTRRERADAVKKRDVFTKYQGAARQVLEALLDKYADAGIEPIEDRKVLQLPPFNQIGAPVELLRAFGGKDGYAQALRELEQQLYA